MSRLTEQSFWDAAYDQPGHAGFNPDDPAELNDNRRWRSHADVVFWDEILPRYLTGGEGQRVLEVGSAPGRNLVRLHRRFGLDPWGVEYTSNGAQLNRRRFDAIGVDPAQVIEADALSDDFLASWRDSFDVVFSMGFVEHFTDPAPVVLRHVQLCRPGGLIVVTVPNMRGLNFGLTRFFNADLIPLHHLDIMQPEVLASLFPTDSVEPLFSGYYGSLDLGAFTTPHRVRRWGLRALRGVQWGVNRALAATPADRRVEHRWTSPFVAFIGRRLDGGGTTAR